MSPRAKDIKERINKWDFIKIKSFFMAKENISKMNREPTIEENIFANTSDKDLISKIYKERIRVHSSKSKNPIKKWAKDLNRLLQGGHTEGPETYERMLSVTTYQRDANLNHSEILLHTGQNGHYKQINKQQVLARLWREGNPSTLLVRMQTATSGKDGGICRYTFSLHTIKRRTTTNLKTKK